MKQIYNEDVSHLIKRTNLDYKTLYPNNFEKRKVSLVLNVFNEKTIAALMQKSLNDTALFVKNIMRTWNIPNVKSPDVGRRLNDPDRYPIETPDDQRICYLEKMATSLKLIDNSKQGRGQRIRGLKQETANAWHVSLLGLVNLAKSLLGVGFKYILFGKIR